LQYRKRTIKTNDMEYNELEKAYKLDSIFFVSEDFKKRTINYWCNTLNELGVEISFFGSIKELKQYIYNEIIDDVKKENNGIIENHLSKLFNRNFEDIRTIFEHITNGIVNTIILKSGVYKYFIEED
jgi:hypothetical protein